MYMKQWAFVFLMCAGLLQVKAQPNWDGIWQGNFVIEKNSLLMVLRIEHENDKLKAVMDMPQQMMLQYKNLKLSSRDDSLFLDLPAFGASYKALLQGDSLRGFWSQGGEDIPLVLGRTPEDKAFRLHRPQTPIGPFPYVEREVSFTNKKADIVLSGTLTLPDTLSEWPVVVLVSGSGPQTRDEELLEHRPFLVIADYLTRNGIGVLRYDDRGVGKSQGNFSLATTHDFSSDASAAISFLRNQPNVDRNAIGLIGHSEGGLIAFMQASQNKQLRFAISLAGVAVPCTQLLLMQQDLIREGYGVSEEAREYLWGFNAQFFDLLQTSSSTEDLRNKTLGLLAEAKADLSEEQLEEYGLNDRFVNALIMQSSTPWFKTFVAMIPSAYLKKNRCHLLALNGSHDVQVPAQANIEAFETWVARKPGRFTESHVFNGLNHLFQPCTSGMTTEYAMIETTIDPVVLQYMTDWIKKVLQAQR